jgi:hypothetical protein
MSVTAQKKWYEPTRNEVIGTVCMTMSGLYKAGHEAINYKAFGKGSQFWDIRVSNQNKVKDFPNDMREAFPGSKTIFVMFTDGNHLTGALNTITFTAGTYFVLSDIKNELKQYKGWEKVGFIVVRKLGPFLIRSFVFEKVYTAL